MTTESRIKAIEDRLNELTKSFLQAQKNQVPLTTKIDDASEKIPILNTSKADANAISDVETIGMPSSKTYEKDETFMANGQMHKATTKIWCGNKLVENGNCEPTSISAEIAKLKEE